MRALAAAALLALSLAGCGDAAGQDDFQQTCPAWRRGMSTVVFQEAFQNGSVPQSKFDPDTPTGAGLVEFQGLPLDHVELDFGPGRGGRTQAIGIANGTLELRAYRSDGADGVSEQLLFRDPSTPDPSAFRDMLSWGPGIHRDFSVHVVLAEPGGEPNPDPIVLRWDFLPDADARTPSEAVMLYTAYFWYRTC